ncbi:hypothetical protein [Brassicibacter mesophilus]|uniref:hypothetical protein n=1 Tax=Brassicibacter mesophilus TaxID=745119 RepID=UPI003D215FD1
MKEKKENNQKRCSLKVEGNKYLLTVMDVWQCGEFCRLLVLKDLQNNINKLADC